MGRLLERDIWPVLLAVSVAFGALIAVAVHPMVVVGVALTALGLRWPPLVCVAAVIVASFLAARAWDGLDTGATGDIAGWATLVSDPVDDGGDLRLIVSLDGRRYDARAAGGTPYIADALAGESVLIDATARPFEDRRSWDVARHLVGRLTIRGASAYSRGPPWSRLANGLRRTLVRGTASLDRSDRVLFTGLVLGDDRDQPAVQADSFRAAGLTHLLAVSGQNVAFVLVLAGPLLRRLGFGWRLALTLAVLGFFALVTRFEPSVLRATAMAALAAVSITAGRPMSGLRALSLAVAGLLLVDPLLVHAVAFQLSVGASTGIILFAGPIARVLPGPRVVAELLSVTAAAQAGVAPVAIPIFGGLPAVALPANLLAGPLAGPVTVWGLTGGIVAGLVGGRWAAVIHAPTVLLLDLLQAVASTAGRVPSGQLGFGSLLAGVAGLVGMHLAREGPRALRAGSMAVLAGALIVPTLLFSSRPTWYLATAGVEVYGSPGFPEVAVVASGSADPARLLETMRRRGIRPTLVVLRSDDPALVEALSAVWDDLAVIGPVVAESTSVIVGGLVVTVPSEAGGDVIIRPRSVEGALPGGGGAHGDGVASARGPPSGPSALRHHLSCRCDGHTQPDAGLVL